MASTDIELAFIGKATDSGGSRWPSIKPDAIEVTEAPGAQTAQEPSYSTAHDLNTDRLRRGPSERMNETSLKPVDKGFGAWSFVRMHTPFSPSIDSNDDTPILITVGRSYMR